MFSDLEKNYQANLPQARFLRYYRPRALVVVLATLAVDLSFEFNRWLVYGVMVAVLLLLILVDFVQDYLRMRRDFASIRKAKTLPERFAAYIAADDRRRLDNLISDLRRHHLHTRSDLLLALQYYERRQRTEAQTSVLEWVLTAAVAILSLVVVAYDDGSRAVDLEKLVTVLAPTFGITLLLLTPFLLAKLISYAIDNSRTKVDTSLVEDLAYIYVNFDHFRERLEG